MNDVETDEYWARYAELSTRERIREEGLSGWLLHTTPGILITVAVQLFAVWLLAHLF